MEICRFMANPTTNSLAKLKRSARSMLDHPILTCTFDAGGIRDVEVAVAI